MIWTDLFNSYYSARETSERRQSALMGPEQEWKEIEYIYYQWFLAKKKQQKKQRAKATRCTAGNAYMQKGLPPSRRAFAPLLGTLCWSNVYLRSFLLFVFAINFKRALLSGGFRFSCTVCFYFAVALPFCFVSYHGYAKAKTNIKFCLPWRN